MITDITKEPILLVPVEQPLEKGIYLVTVFGQVAGFLMLPEYGNVNFFVSGAGDKGRVEINWKPSEEQKKAFEYLLIEDGAARLFKEMKNIEFINGIPVL